MHLPDAIAHLTRRFGDDVAELPEFRGEAGMRVNRARILDVCRVLKSECAFDMLTDLSGVDNQGEAPRFEVHYLAYSLTHRCRLRLKVGVPEEDPTVDSVTGVWPTANWHEREAYDMFGLRFRGHPDLRRILMWEGYPHHPLRKDFPLAGLPAELPATAVNAGAAEPARMAGGPFVAAGGTVSAVKREPRARRGAADLERQAAEPDRQEEV